MKPWALDPDQVIDLSGFCAFDIPPMKRRDLPWIFVGCPGCGGRHYNDEECSKLEVRPVSLRVANAWIDRHHRHHGPARGHKFSVCLMFAGEMVGAAVAGRPVGRHDDDGRSLEVTRMATDGIANGCSKLYGAIVRCAKAMGFWRVITFTLPEECGGSLRAVGFVCQGLTKGRRGWNRPGRPRRDAGPIGRKKRWVILLGEGPADE